jgi:glycosyltransferase involved in cell wall biosynthesis
MRLCLLAEASSIHTRRWAQHFAARGDEVLVLSLRPGDIPGARVGVVAPPRLGRLGYLLGWPRARAAVRAFRPDLVHAHYATSYGLLGALVDRHPYVISSWGSDVTAGQAGSPLWRRLLRFAYRRADAACATSRFLAEATRPFVRPGAEIVVTPFGVDLERFPFRPPPRREVVTIGAARFRLESIYGLAHLIAAFARLEDRRARLVVYGQGGQRPALERQARALGLGERIRFPGFVPPDRLPAALDALDVLAMPSIVPEAFGVAAVEASAIGLPVVASAIGGLPEVVEDGRSGYLVPPGDEAALADRLGALVADPDLRARLGAHGRSLITRCYDWRKNAQVMVELYEKLVYEEATSA